jgi:hypothetical protein
MPKENETALLQTIALHIPKDVTLRLRLAIMSARDNGESWKSLEARTLIDQSNLVKMAKGKRYIGPATAVRLAHAFGFELQMKIVARKKKAA